MVVSLSFCWRNVANGFQQTVMVIYRTRNANSASFYTCVPYAYT
jgi:hypothetical protein